MVVEWLRECYKSRWRLFNDSNATTTGRYYWSPPDAVHYPGVHNLGSRRWHDQNCEIIQGLGEDLTAKWTHQSGDWPGIMPEQVFVGSQGCLRDGDPIDDQADPALLFNGYPDACYLPPPAPPEPHPPLPPNQDYARFSAFDRCQTTRMWARVLDWSYLDDAPSIIACLTAFSTSPATITFHPVEGNYPAVTTVVAPEYAVACLDGTRNAQQLALQAFQGIQGPTNHGAFSTVPLWMQAAHDANVKLQADGVNDTRPIFLVGHSYGAAAALVLAALFRYWAPTRTIKYLVFGCPKIGDERIAALLRRVDGVALANSNDLVTTLPPDRETMAPLLVLFPLLNFAPFYLWERPPATTTQRVDGSLVPGPPPGLDYQTMLTMITRVVLAEEQEAIVGHSISEYERRIALRCPDAGFPVTVPVLLLIEEEDELPGGLVFAGGPGTWEGSGTILFGGVDSPAAGNGGLMFDGTTTAAPGNGGLQFGG